MNMHVRHRFNPLMVLLLGVALSGTALAATGGAAAPAQNSADKTARSTPAPNPALQKALQVARGAKEWHAVCGSCHNLRDPRELTDNEWEVAMGQMRVRAHLTGLQERDITAFLKASN
ncbi:hypothetical protein [Oleiagrimonas sp. C23AA]|uniref:hypothetical protein n=1 Tax=Oleiagrimonas sp. C23AA TaxID=2719047 RepID=UPI001422E0CA|nr:hypothetical protein [Oleiagrimonas sp. C23AA]NII11198.1 hypothetical protein [Oleiagrimonas sp. C23AA]